MSDRVPNVPDGAYSTTIQLRWGDMDRLGHINNVQWLRLLEEARVRFFLELHPRGETGVTFVAARHEIDYLTVLRYSTAPIAVHIWLDRMGRSSFGLAYVVHDSGGRPVVAARTVIVSVDPDSGRAVPLPDPVRRRAEEHLAA